MKETPPDNQTPHLPKGWILTTVGNISNLIHYGFTESATASDTGTKFLRITDIQNNNVDWGKVPFCKISDEARKKYALNERDLLFARTGATVGKSFLIRGKIPQSVFASYLIRIILSKDVDERFVYYFFQSSSYWLQIRENQVGIGQPNVNGTILSTLKLPLPPLAEQERIVLKIEELFTKLEAGVSELKQARAQVKRYRQAVLKSAVTGELTRVWREANQTEPAEILLKKILKERREKWKADQLEKFAEKGKIPKNDDWKKKYKEPASPATENLPELPKGWAVANVEQISLKVQYGSSAKTNTDSSGIPVFRMGNIFEGKLLCEDFKYLPQNHNEFPELLLEAKDLLFNRTNSAELVGKTAVYKGNIKLSSFASYLIRVKTSESYSPDFLSFFINSALGRSWIATVVSQQVGQANVNGTKLQALAVPLPPLAEQEMIAEEVERLLSVADAVERTIEESLKQAERLRQSILRKAFTGKLAAQDERDEPASVLLERIKAERDKIDANKKPKGEKRKLKETVSQKSLPFTSAN